MDLPQSITLQILEECLVDISSDQHHAAVVLRTNQRVLTSHNSGLPFTDAVPNMAYKVAVKARTQAIVDILHYYPLATRIDMGDVDIPIVTSFEFLEEAIMYDGALVRADAAAQREDQVLVVWSNQTDTIVEDYHFVEHQLRHFIGLCTCKHLSVAPHTGIQSHHEWSYGATGHGQSLISRYLEYEGLFGRDLQARPSDGDRPSRSTTEQALPITPVKTRMDPSLPYWNGSRWLPRVPQSSANPAASIPSLIARSTQIRTSPTSNAFATSSGLTSKMSSVFCAGSPSLHTQGKGDLEAGHHDASAENAELYSNVNRGDEDSIDESVHRRIQSATVTGAARARPYTPSDECEPSTLHTAKMSNVLERSPQSSSHRITQARLPSPPQFTAAEKRKECAIASTNVDEPGPSVHKESIRAQPRRIAMKQRLGYSKGDDDDGDTDHDVNSDADEDRRKMKREPPKNKKAYACPLRTCEWSFDTRRDFRRHLLQCFKVRKHVCDSCGMRFPRTDALKRHRKGQNACEDYLKRCARQAEARENPGNGRVASGGRVGPPGLNEEILGILRQFLYDDEMDALLEDVDVSEGADTTH
ncbi:hypothetical protein POSPLADRAFT_1158332 [Postia placenta MAD-698-R-SB12]|uniref:C2H2-type domain-containing protein n=1 Tax=Postia placenta MAD-698-R-SB12 TaxID=670580 RepID=A0A1X6ML35_9APHY|nr:hypothetical protein POSPLADRAFT_1158332 [Postia placenta MAD-698-R-SB12]OSX56912.1 hypothetical protein POSPLADRAFT_1158332 [Postia placenta MAD-698-R-SB12]